MAATRPPSWVVPRRSKPNSVSRRAAAAGSGPVTAISGNIRTASVRTSLCGALVSYLAGSLPQSWKSA